jgi:hypothetical protein
MKDFIGLTACLLVSMSTTDVAAAPPGEKRPPVLKEDTPSQQQLKSQYDQLGNIQVLSLSATPAVVPPFGTTTISWKVAIPSNLGRSVSPFLGSQQLPGLSGTMTLQVFEDTTFGLLAKGGIISRGVGALTIKVDTTACIHKQIPQLLIEVPIRQQIKQALSGNQFKIDDKNLKVDFTNGLLAVSIPGNISIPYWFDMTMTVNTRFSFGSIGHPPDLHTRVTAEPTSVHIAVGKLSSALSVGYAKAAGDGLEKMAQVLMPEIANNQVAPQISAALSEQIARDIADARGDVCKQGPAYTLISFLSSDDGLSYVICPIPATLTIAPAPK